MRQIVILGDILCTEHIQGISRYAYEIIKVLDLQIDDLDVVIGYPAEKKILIEGLSNIKLMPMVVAKGKHFRKDVFRRYVNKNGCVAIDLGPGYSYYKYSVITFHDMRPLEHLNYDPIKAKIRLKLMALIAKYKKNTRVVTVSNYQKNRIHILTGINLSKIDVIGNGWEHITRWNPDQSVFDKFPSIKKNEYYYALGSVAPHKNYRWIYEFAKRNKDIQFVIAGNIDLPYWGIDDSNLKASNVIFTGYVSDEENIALMKNCKVFIHPSKYEGFGIPPLEALALNKNVLVSNATCLPEIYGDSVEYIDPDEYCINIDNYMWKDQIAKQKVLREHSWKNSANGWLDIMEKMAMS